MNIRFCKLHLPPLHLPPLPEVNADSLVKLAGNEKNQGLQAPKLPADVTKSKIVSRSNLDEIIEDIENGKSENITSLEWIHYLYNKNKWDVKNPDRSIPTSKAIWKAAERNAWLKQKLFWNLVLNYSSKNALATSLVQSLTFFVPQNSSDKGKIKIAQILAEPKSEQKLAMICLQQALTPYQLFYKYGLPTNAQILYQVRNNLVNQFISLATPLPQQVDWLLKCLTEMRDKQQIKAVEHLLITADSKLGAEYPKLINWLRQYYGSAIANSRWNDLSPEAKAAMRKWLGAVSYQDFQKIVDLILVRGTLTDKERKNLKSRKTFWSHYSDRFRRIRILLPETSVNILSSHLHNQDFSVLDNDGSEASEVCIFDLGNITVAEIFRGDGSEIRLYNKQSTIESILFEDPLSIKYLRYLNSTHHDHVVCWQYFCVEELRKNNIFPNDNIECFKGLPPEVSTYDRDTGLPEPTPEILFARQQQLYGRNSVGGWIDKICRLEKEAEEYFEPSELEFYF